MYDKAKSLVLRIMFRPESVIKGTQQHKHTCTVYINTLMNYESNNILYSSFFMDRFHGSVGRCLSMTCLIRRVED